MGLPNWLLNPLGGAIGSAAGKVLGKVADWWPKKGEHYRAKIREIKKEMDTILKQPFTYRSRARYAYLADQLRKAEAASQDRES
jgi:hypothetical protein